MLATGAANKCSINRGEQARKQVSHPKTLSPNTEPTRSRALAADEAEQLNTGCEYAAWLLQNVKAAATPLFIFHSLSLCSLGCYIPAEG